jgi:SH3-like domain-containing protein
MTRSTTLVRLIASAALMLAAGASHALDFKSVGAAPAILYDAPSTKGGKLFVAPRGMPVEIVLSYGDWVKVRDAGGDLAWVEARALSPKRTVVVKAATAKVRTSADENATLSFTADKGVLLDLLEVAPGGWIKVRHRDGATGYLKSSDIWGI